jgi:hypothetical protein
MLVLDSSAGDYSGHIVRYSVETPTVSPGAPGAVASQQVTEVLAPALGDAGNPFNQHRMFWESVRDRREPFVSIDSGVDDLRVVAAAYESARNGRAVILNA